MSHAVVIAFGGNALSPEASSGAHEEQLVHAHEMAEFVAGLVRDGVRLILTHGNGPHAGNLAIQQENAAEMVAPQPLSTLVAMTQGQIGNLLALPIQQRLPDHRGRVATVVTHVVVDRDDPEFDSPTKPIGPFFSEADARKLADERGWIVAPVSDDSFRRVVPSPAPREILELPIIRALHEAGELVIATGGGGIPVIDEPDGSITAIDAVIDKDLAAALLATSLDADVLVMLTAVPEVFLDFGTPQQRAIDQMTVAEAEKYLADGQFPAGSMGPKMRAAIDFVRDGGSLSIITDTAHVREAIEGRHGTRITRS